MIAVARSIDKQLAELVQQRRRELDAADRWTTMAAQALGNAAVLMAQIEKLLDERSCA